MIKLFDNPGKNSFAVRIESDIYSEVVPKGRFLLFSPDLTNLVNDDTIIVAFDGETHCHIMRYSVLAGDVSLISFDNRPAVTMSDAAKIMAVAINHVSDNNSVKVKK